MHAEGFEVVLKVWHSILFLFSKVKINKADQWLALLAGLRIP